MFSFSSESVSDVYKDAYGFRPGQDWWARWKAATDVEKQKIWNDLQDRFDHELEADRVEMIRTQKAFEKIISDSQDAGAPDRETAIRWWLQNYAEDLEYGIGHLLYREGFDHPIIFAEVVSVVNANPDEFNSLLETEKVA